MAEADGAGTSNAPARASLVLAALILVAAVANLNLAVANVALPSIAKEFDSSQTMLDLISASRRPSSTSARSGIATAAS